MKKALIPIFVALFLGLVQLTYADQSQFCAGFTEGYRSVKGNFALVPLCPMAPITPIGSTDFREGIKAGIRAASASSGSATGQMRNSSINENDFCAGFREGYKTIKGDFVIIPICPIAPITPIGSTPYREGIKAGIRAASRY